MVTAASCATAGRALRSGCAARQVGQDLHALKVEHLEAEKADLSQEVSILSAKLDVALTAIGQRA